MGGPGDLAHGWPMHASKVVVGLGFVAELGIRQGSGAPRTSLIDIWHRTGPVPAAFWLP